MPDKAYEWQSGDRIIVERVISDLLTCDIPFHMSRTTDEDGRSVRQISVAPEHSRILRELTHIDTYEVGVSVDSARTTLRGAISEIFSIDDDAIRKLIVELYPSHNGDRVIDAEVDDNDYITLHVEKQNETPKLPPKTAKAQSSLRKTG